MLRLLKARHSQNPLHPYVSRLLRVGLGALGGLVLLGALAAPAASAQTAPTGTSHQVQLTWTAPTAVGGSGTISGYNVYRALGTGSYVKLNATVNAPTTYTDTTVAAGSTYSYCASTIDSTSHESVCSAPASATIPSNPNAPTSIIIVIQ